MIINNRKVKGDDELCELLRTEFKGHLGERKAGVFWFKDEWRGEGGAFIRCNLLPEATISYY